MFHCKEIFGSTFDTKERAVHTISTWPHKGGSARFLTESHLADDKASPCNPLIRVKKNGEWTDHRFNKRWTFVIGSYPNGSNVTLTIYGD